MFNLLPNAAKKTVLIEYRLRAVSLCLVAAACTLLLAGASLIPSYSSSIDQHRLFENEYRSVHEIAQQKVDASVTALLSATKGKLELSKPYLETSTASDMVSRIVSHQSSGIFLTAFRFGPDEISADGRARKVTLAGRAADRQSLLRFYQNLQAEKKFQLVVLPVSDFQKSSNIEFTISFLSLM